MKTIYLNYLMFRYIMNNRLMNKLTDLSLGLDRWNDNIFKRNGDIWARYYRAYKGYKANS